MGWKEVNPWKCSRCGRTVKEAYFLPSSPDKPGRVCKDCVRKATAEKRASKGGEKKRKAAAPRKAAPKKAQPPKSPNGKVRTRKATPEEAKKLGITKAA